MTPREWPHWRRRLGEVQDLCLVAHDADGVARAVLQLVSVLTDEWDAWATETGVLRQLVREAAELLTTPRSRLQVEAWLHRARVVLEERGDDDKDLARWGTRGNAPDRRTASTAREDA